MGAVLPAVIDECVGSVADQGGPVDIAGCFVEVHVVRLIADGI
jgi:hypothetical protein